MELNITQRQLEVVRDNEVDSLGNKIKLKASSLVNLVKHVVNVPVMGETKVAESEPVQVPVQEVDSSYTLLPNDFTEAIDGEFKPINVKEKMINGMRSNYNKLVPFVSVAVETPEVSFVDAPSVSSEVQVEPTVEVTNNEEKVTEEVKQETIVNTETISIENDDMSKMFEQVSNARETLLRRKEEASRAEAEAEQSEQQVQELGVQFTEAEKQLQMAEKRKQELQKMIIVELRTQLSTMSSEEQKYGDTITSANLRKEESQNKIIDFETKINDYNQKISAVNDDIARDEEKYHTLIGMNPITMEQEQAYKKVA